MSQPYPIEKGVPLAQRRAERQRKYPIRDLEIGDSFLVPSDDMHRNLAQSVRNIASEHGFKIAVRKVEYGVRVWRVQ